MPMVGAVTGGNSGGGAGRRGARLARYQVRDPLLLVPVTPGEHTQPGPVVVLEGRLGDAGELEEQLVPGHLTGSEGRRGPRMRHGDHGQRADPVWAEYGGEPG